MNDPVPSEFPYAEVLRRGKPHHGDHFLYKHPPMDPLRRAKIFHSYDALKGFKELLATKEK